MTATLDVMVLNYNGRHLLETCLPSVILAARLARSIKSRVVLVDNQSHDGSLDYISRVFPEVMPIQAPSNDFLFSMNWAAACSDAQWLILLNNDVKPHADSFDSLLEPLFSDPTIFSCSPSLFRVDGVTVDACQRWGEFRRGFLHHESRVVSELSPTLFPSGGAFAVSRAAFLALGGFDPLFHPAYWEDIDLGYRAWKAGFRNLHQPVSTMIHIGSASWQQHDELARRISRRNTYLFTWSNVSDSHLLLPSLWWTARYYVSALRRHDSLQSRAICEAIGRLPHVLERRRGWSHQKSFLSDQEICRVVASEGFAS